VRGAHVWQRYRYDFLHFYHRRHRISLLFLEALATSDSKKILLLAQACSPNSSGCRKSVLASSICCPADIESCWQRCKAFYSH
jgi:hypothetical protein